MGWEVIGNDKPLTWKKFEQLVLKDIEAAEEERKKAQDPAECGDWIFRGQANSAWGLDTSFERYLKNEFGVVSAHHRIDEYYYFLSSIVPAVNSLTKNKFSRVVPFDVGFSSFGHVPHLELLCYARHHGFPTPLLDWTKSYYIAAFFAYRHARKGEDVALFSYREWTGHTRGGWVAEPMIDEQGPYVETHPRHYKQQSVYTVCRAVDGDHLTFMNHESAVEKNAEDHHIKKYILNANEKEKVLSRLHSMNINDYTLFGDEEALLRSLAFEHSRKYWGDHCKL